jgi:hypothetical protein
LTLVERRASFLLEIERGERKEDPTEKLPPLPQILPALLVVVLPIPFPIVLILLLLLTLPLLLVKLVRMWDPLRVGGCDGGSWCRVRDVGDVVGEVGEGEVGEVGVVGVVGVVGAVGVVGEVRVVLRERGGVVESEGVPWYVELIFELELDWDELLSCDGDRRFARIFDVKESGLSRADAG